jgi:hypothetical protein
VPGALALEQVAIGGIGAGFAREQEGRAHLHRLRAQLQGGGNAAIHDAAGGDHRPALRGQQAHQGEGPDLLILVFIEDAAMATGLDALRHDGIHPGRFDLACLVQAGGAGHQEDPGLLEDWITAASGRPKWKLTTAGAVPAPVAACRYRR